MVTAMNGKPIRDMNDLRVSLALAKPGSTTRLKVVRNGKQQEIPVQIAMLPEAPAPQTRQNQNPMDGVQVQDLNAQMLRDLGLAPNTRGMIVANIPEGSMAELDDLHRGDVIQELNRTPITNMNDFRKALAASESRRLLLLVNRGGTTM